MNTALNLAALASVSFLLVFGVLEIYFRFFDKDDIPYPPDDKPPKTTPQLEAELWRIVTKERQGNIFNLAQQALNGHSPITIHHPHVVGFMYDRDTKTVRIEVGFDIKEPTGQ